MIITYNGLESFKITHGDLTIAVNPVSKDSKAKSTKFGADITLITTNHPDFNGEKETSRADKEPFVISGPGEYEVKDVFIRGYPSEANYSGSKLNTVYLITFEGMNLCFLGALSNASLPSETLEVLENLDIIFTPIGGEEKGVLSPAAAYKLAVSLEPSIIIPMHYDDATLKQFLKEGGTEKLDSQEKLVIKKKDVENKGANIVVLKEE